MQDEVLILTMFYVPSNCEQASSTCISHYKYTNFGFLLHKLSRIIVIIETYIYIYIRNTRFVFRPLVEAEQIKSRKESQKSRYLDKNENENITCPFYRCFCDTGTR